MNLDAKLLREQSAQRAGDLRETRRDNIRTKSGNANQTAEGSNFFEAKKAAKDKKEGGLVDKAMDVATTPLRAGTSKILQQSWLHLADSFGFTLLWPNLHVLLKAVFGEKLFCKLGAEWSPDIPVNSGEAKVLKEKVGGGVEKIETMGLGSLDLGCLLLNLTIIFLVAMIIGIISNPLKAIPSLIKLFFWPG